MWQPLSVAKMYMHLPEEAGNFGGSFKQTGGDDWANAIELQSLQAGVDFFLPLSCKLFKAWEESSIPGSPCWWFVHQQKTMAEGIIYLMVFCTLDSPVFGARRTCCGIVLLCPFSKGEPRRANCWVAATPDASGRQLGAGHALQGAFWVSFVVSTIIPAARLH